MSATTLDQSAPLPRLGLASLVWLLMAALTALIIAGLALPLRAPLGSMYWDSFLYLDAANRLGTGQMPNVDFFTPVGPLEYYLSTWTMALFPDAQPMYAANWSIAIITVPLMALVLWDVARRNALVALALAIPFALFTLLPFNTTEYYNFPGSDGFGIYNRHASQLLYVLTTALIFVRSRALLVFLVSTLMLVLFLVKVTGFAAAGLICLVALAAGRIHLVGAIASAVIFAAALAGVELATGLVSAYVGDVVALLQINDASLASRLVQGASRVGGTVIFAGLLGALLVLVLPARPNEGQPLWRAVCDHPAIWLGAALVGGIFFESQNTGSQELIALWPVIIVALARMFAQEGGNGVKAAAALLAACTVLPPAVQTIQHAARANIGMLRQAPLQHENLGAMGQVTIRPRKLERHERMRAHYIKHAEATRAIAMRRELPAFVLYSEHDFQIGLMKNADELVGELKRLEAGGLDYRTIMTLDFANPFPWLLDKSGPRHIAIGADPYRAVPTPDADVYQAVADTDIVLEPQCPYRDNSRELYAIYAPALAGHVKVRLTDCYAAYVRPQIAAQLGG
ncbi:MAG: hypothetical protein JJ920_05025 [Roseitalea sp.]|jgi:hypothetical protein|nr:hypothetical protein [Roseitalea sp.]MBO6721264.1 hypothetical protein [Roseitalea sp.]MBO6742252.1 hypothetical protein [Roseitalea sp.]